MAAAGGAPAGAAGGGAAAARLAVFSLDAVRACTGGFSRDSLLGRGGFGTVHEGRLDGRAVAVKRLRLGGGSSQARRACARAPGRAAPPGCRTKPDSARRGARRAARRAGRRGVPDGGGVRHADSAPEPAARARHCATVPRARRQCQHC
jgi:hypothetical protein